MMSQRTRTGSARRIWVAVFAMITLALLAGGYWYYRKEAKEIRQQNYQTIAAIGELKSGQIEQWRKERLADVTVAAKGPSLIRAVRDLSRDAANQGLLVALREYLNDRKMVYGYSDALLLARDGKILVAAKDAPNPVDPATERAAAAAFASREAVLSDFFREPDGIVYIDAAAVVRDADGQPLAVAVLRSNAETHLYPLIQSWPMPSRSAETLLVQREGEDVVFLNQLRHRSRTALTLREPLTRTTLPAVQAVLGTHGSFQGKDYRDVEVLTDLRPIPGSPWFIVAKVDADEILAEARYRAGVTGVVVGSLILLVAAATAYGYRQRQVGVFQDLYESERQQREAQEAFRTTLYSIGDAVITADAGGRVREMNPVAERLTGWTEAEARGKPLEDVFQIINEPTRAPVENPVNTVLRDGAVVRLANHAVLIARDGTERPITDSAAPIRDDSGAVSGVVLVFSDQTVPHAARQALRESTVRYRSLFQHMLNGFAYCRMQYDDHARPVDFVYLDVNEAFGRLTGLTNVVGKPVSEVIPGIRELSPELFEAYGRVASTGIPETFEFDFKSQRQWLTISVYSPEKGYFVAVFDDITERKRAEAELRLESAALNAAANAIIITDRNGTIAWINPAFTALTGYSADEAIGKNPRDLVKSGVHDQAFYKHLWDTILAGHVWHGEMTNRRKDGSLYPEDLTITPVKDARGEIAHFIAIKRDRTEHQRLEAQFLQAQKMESVGRLAGGIAHDFNNLLTVINGTAELASTDLSEDNPLRADLQHIKHAGDRAASLTRQLLAFSRKQIMKLDVLNLSTLVADMQSMLRRLIGEDIDLVVVPAKDVGNVLADPGQIEQVIMNLAVNARDAMLNGGRLTIETQDIELDTAFAVTHPSVQPGPHVMLAVSDTGVGMDEATRMRLFEPFFTTKEPGKGTGLGLATVYGIVKQSGGSIWVYSELGRGATFRIYLPRVDEVAHTGQPARTLTALRGTETILVVEDEKALRHLATRMLQSAGYTVLTASNGEEALLLLDRHDGPVHLMLTDVVMPGMSGRDLATQLADAHPRMKILFTSGYTDDAILRHGALDDVTHFIGKPYTVAELTRKVREVLDSQ